MNSILLTILISASPPPGLIDLCVRGDGPNKFECEYVATMCLVKPDKRCKDLYLRWRKRLQEINDRINSKFQVQDEESGDDWQVSTTGDCEDAALVKEQALLDAGYPAELMGIGTGYLRCSKPDGCHHAVLLVRIANEILVMDLDLPVISTRDYEISWSWFPEYLTLK